MKIISIDKVEVSGVKTEGANGAWKQLPLGSSDGTPVYSFRVFTLDPLGNTPYHSHPFEHMNYIIEGEGELMDEAGNRHPLRQGDFAFVKSGEKHQYRNASSDKIFKMICGVPKEYE
jgi:quercetin dioxygenase-like cupin family protein